MFVDERVRGMLADYFSSRGLAMLQRAPARATEDFIVPTRKPVKFPELGYRGSRAHL